MHLFIQNLRSVSTSRFGLFAAAVMAPAVVFFVYGVEPLFIQNGVDPFIYAGYTFEMGDLIDRFGYPYYAVRPGLIVTTSLFDLLFGSTGGYFALRWVLMSASISLLFVWGRKLSGAGVGLFAATAFLINPIVFRSVMTVYSDTVGVPFVVMAYTLLLFPGSDRHRRIACAGAGILVALTINANIFMALPLGLALTCWFAVRVWSARRAGIIEAGTLIGSAFVVTALFCLFYAIRFGDGNIFQPSIDAARRIDNLGLPMDRDPTRQWLNFRTFLFLPLVSVVALGSALRIGRVRPNWIESAAVVMLAAPSAVLLYEEFIAEGYLLETYYYTSYFFGPTVIVLALAFVRLAQAFPARHTLARLAGFISVALFPFVWTLSLSDISFWSLPTVPVVLVVVVGLIVACRRLSSASVVAMCLLAICPLLFTLGAPANVPLAAGQAFRREPLYNLSMFNPDYAGLEQYELASEFMELVPDWVDAPGTAIFWFPDDDIPANLLASTFLWHTNALSLTPPGLPSLDIASADRLVGRTPRFVVLIASNASRVDEGEAVLRAILEPISSQLTSLTAGAFTVYVEIMEFSPSSCDLESKGREYIWVAYAPCS